MDFMEKVLFTLIFVLGVALVAVQLWAPRDRPPAIVGDAADCRAAYEDGFSDAVEFSACVLVSDTPEQASACQESALEKVRARRQ